MILEDQIFVHPTCSSQTSKRYVYYLCTLLLLVNLIVNYEHPNFSGALRHIRCTGAKSI